MALYRRRLAARQFGGAARFCRRRRGGWHHRGRAPLSRPRRRGDVPGLRRGRAGRSRSASGAPRLSPAGALHLPCQGAHRRRAHAARDRDRGGPGRGLVERLSRGRHAQPPRCSRRRSWPRVPPPARLPAAAPAGGADQRRAGVWPTTASSSPNAWRRTWAVVARGRARASCAHWRPGASRRAPGWPRCRPWPPTRRRRRFMPSSIIARWGAIITACWTAEDAMPTSNQPNLMEVDWSKIPPRTMMGRRGIWQACACPISPLPPPTGARFRWPGAGPRGRVRLSAHGQARANRPDRRLGR